MKREKKNGQKSDGLSKSAASGAVALIFLILGFQTALFFVKFIQCPAEPASVDAGKVEQGQDRERLNIDSSGGRLLTEADAPGLQKQDDVTNGRNQQFRRTKLGGYPKPPDAYGGYRNSSSSSRRAPESFPFDPNTVTLEELQRLGLSERQAESIENYRSKGGRFRRKSDFKKMYVVSDSLYERLEGYIDIPKVELNSADSSALVSLPGIGPYFAKKIIAYRGRLGGFYDISQLLEIDGFDTEKMAGLLDLISVDTTKIRHLDVWGAPRDSLAVHPYVGPYAAKGLVRLREVLDTARWTVENIAANNILTDEMQVKIIHYICSFKQNKDERCYNVNQSPSDSASSPPLTM